MTGYMLKEETPVSVMTGVPPTQDSSTISDGFVLFTQVYIILILIVGVTGNVLTIAAVCRYSKLHTPTNAFILHLSLMDALYLVWSLPFRWATYYYHNWLLGETFCNLHGAFSHTFFGLSVMTLGVIATNRLVHVVYTEWYSTLYTRMGIAIQLLIMYIVVCFIAFILPVANIWGHYEYDSHILSCTFSRQHDPAYKFLVIGVGTWVPCTFIISCYIRIFIHVRQSHRRMQRWSTSHTPPLPQQQVARGNQVSPMQDLSDICRTSQQGSEQNTNNIKAIQKVMDSLSGHCDQTQVMQESAVALSNGVKRNSTAFQGQNASQKALVGILKSAEPQSISSIAVEPFLCVATLSADTLVRRDINRKSTETANIKTESADENKLSVKPSVPDTTSKSYVPLDIPELCEANLPSTSHARTSSSKIFSNTKKFKPKNPPIKQRRQSTLSQFSISSRKSVTFQESQTSLGNLRTRGASTDSALPHTGRAVLVHRTSLVQKNRRQAVRLSLMMLVTFCVFCASTLPYFTIHFITNKEQFPTAYFSSLIISWLNSCLNPIIYALMNVQFRYAYKHMLSKAMFCKLKHHRHQNVQPPRELATC